MIYKAKTLVCLWLAFLFVFSGMQAFAITPDEELSEAMKQLNHYLTVFNDNDRKEDVSITDIRDAFMKLGSYSFASGFYQYSSVLLYLSKEDYRSAYLFKDAMKLNADFDEFIQSSDFTKQYPSIRNVEELSTYVDARIAENNAKVAESEQEKEKAVELYQKCSLFYDSTQRWFALVGGSSEQRYERALSLFQQEDYEAAYWLFKDLDEWNYKDSAVYLRICIEMTDRSWSEWLDELPKDLDLNKLDIEEQVLYRVRDKKTTTSKDSVMDGWTLVGNTQATGGFGEWSQWGPQEYTSDENRDVEKRTVYRYADLEKTSSASSSLSGWEADGNEKKYSDWGTWSNWNETPQTSSDTRQVSKQTQYSARKKQYTSSTNSSLSGWTQYNSTQSYSAWGAWSGWSTSAVSSSSTRDVDTKVETETTYTTQYNYKCYHYYNTNQGKWMQSYADNSSYPWSTKGSWKYFSSPTKLKAYGTYDGRTGYLYNGYLVFDNGTSQVASGSTSTTYYRYRDRTLTTTYSYWKWGEWSAWSTTKPSGDETRQRTIYQYRDRTMEMIYYYKRWGKWSDWSTNKYTASNQKKVETATWYRYRDRTCEPLYFFEQYGPWSDWTETKPAESDTIQIDAKTQYRYKERT